MMLKEKVFSANVLSLVENMIWRYHFENLPYYTQMNTQLHISVLSSHNQANYSDIEIPGGLLGGGSVVIVNRQS